MKPIKKSKTVWFNAIVGSTAAMLSQVGIDAIAGVPLEQVTAAVMTIGNIILRFVTTEPVSIKPPM